MYQSPRYDALDTSQLHHLIEDDERKNGSKVGPEVSDHTHVEAARIPRCPSFYATRHEADDRNDASVKEATYATRES
jgi:hypothetical protein